MKRTRIQRQSKKYRNVLQRRRAWAVRVKSRDLYCQAPCCHKVNVQAHHVYPKGHYPQLDTVMDNGLSLCPECHALWHRSVRQWRRWWEANWPRRAAHISRLLAKKDVAEETERAYIGDVGTEPTTERTEE